VKNALGVLKAILSVSLDRAYLYLDKKLVRRTRNLRLVPAIANRRGGRISYGEWCYEVGILQSILFHHLGKRTNSRILDVGCGTGIVGIASEPFLGQDGEYLGIDVSKRAIEFCKKHYPPSRFTFKHLDVMNRRYAPGQASERTRWDVADESIDMVTAVSVWTHLSEEDATFYFREIDRVLKPGGKAIITFFLLDRCYHRSLRDRTEMPGEYHAFGQSRWIFDVPCSDSQDWFHPQWVEEPEDAIGIRPAGIDAMLERTSLRLVNTYGGTWKEMPGVFFQDVLVFEKAAGEQGNDHI
jgi:SAM-dependent methyltransferase